MQQLETLANLLWDNILHNQLVPKLVLGVILLLTLSWLVRALFYAGRRQWEVFWYALLCGALLLWAGLSLAALLWPQSAAAPSLQILRHIGEVFFPALLCLHIWKQVSYKDITWLVASITLLAPTILTVLLVHSVFVPPANGQLVLTQLWVRLFYFAYTTLALIKCYLLCFSVFYQMPRHMRRSTYYTITGISVLTVLSIVQMVQDIIPSLNLTLPAACFTLYFLFDALSTASSANVIVTSRDYVFNSLSTMILVLSNSMRVLDWNKTTTDTILPTPRYREPYRRYRERMLKECNGRVSPHGENIITALKNGTETNYLITIREVRGKKRTFGNLVEIAEVTKLYSVLRYFEDIATVDQLTNLYNRNAYLNMVRQLVEQNVLPLLVVVGDVNGLKRLNDTQGHLYGDALLTAVSAHIRTCAPENAYACRIGGDEYVLLLPGGSEQTAQTFIQQVNLLCENSHDDRYGRPSIAWGYALRTNEEEDYNEIFARADAMMYAAKKSHFQFTSSGMVPPTPPAPPAQP